MISGNLLSQVENGKKLKRADKYFNAYSYVKAKSIYKRFAHDTANHNAITRLAECYYFLHDWPDSEKMLKTVISYRQVDPRYYLLYAQALKSNGKIKESDEWMMRFHDSRKDDSRGLNFISKENHWEKILSEQSRFDIKPVKFNSAEADFSPTLYKNNELIFISARINNFKPVQRYYSWNERPFLDLYSINLNNDKTKGKGKIFLEHVNTKFHDGPVCFDSTFSTMYVTRNNFHENKAGSSSDGINKLKLFRYKFSDGEWKSAELLPFNSDEYSVGHACLSGDNKRLFFVSDQPGGFGGTDIYTVDINPDGSFGSVKNLGKEINTEGNEMFPFVDRNEVLFFSSDGHPGLGRLDIFYAVPTRDGAYRRIKNAGIVANSPADDFGIIFKNPTEGYFASNRAGGMGDDDIYEFILSEPVKSKFYIQGNVTDLHDKIILKNSLVTLIDQAGNIIDSVETDSLGNFLFKVNEGESYTIKASAIDYITAEKNIGAEIISEENPVALYNLELIREAEYTMVLLVKDIKTKEVISGASVKMTDKATGFSEVFKTGPDGTVRKSLKENKNSIIRYEIVFEKEGYLTDQVHIERKLVEKGDFLVETGMGKPEVGMDIAKIVEILPIYFDLGKSTIRLDAATELDKIVVIMNAYPGMVIELGSHTDSRGSDAANFQLSQKRATASADYIISRGINAERIIGKGYGESKLINQCHNGVKCSEKDHQANRRTEFIIKKI
jgi:outer membrane protein OmpA-like peptidoglycan-associated protein